MHASLAAELVDKQLEMIVQNKMPSYQFLSHILEAVCPPEINCLYT
jgi:hypothetical protein